MKFINVKFLDSYVFLDMRLADFPASLGFDDFTKGYHHGLELFRSYGRRKVFRFGQNERTQA